MIRPEEINISAYQYTLPEERIARYPLSERDRSKVLVYRSGEISRDYFFQIPELLPEGSTLIFNTTRVIHARLQFRKSTGARIEIFCLEPREPADYERSMQAKSGCLWQCMIGNKKKWKGEVLSGEFGAGSDQIQLSASLASSGKNADIIKFTWLPENKRFGDILEATGSIPIPPYLNRKAEEVDETRYQTVYAKQKGSVAAPTAGLHFTPHILRVLQEKNIPSVSLTLHVGAGTFKPVKSPTLKDHAMHTEHFLVQKSQLQKLVNNKGPVISVGTTSVRTLESLYWLGVKIKKSVAGTGSELFMDQWEPYSMSSDTGREDALETLLRYMEKNKLDKLEGSTRLIIVPGYKYRMIDGLITNYHMPRSTLLLLVAAFIGDDWKKVYQYALDNEFRFLSYGDSSLLLP